MFSSRKEIEELEAKVDFVVDGQLKLVSLQADIERSLGEQLNLIQVASEQNLEKQRAWLKQMLETIWNDFSAQFKQQQSEVVVELQSQSERTRDQLSQLMSEMRAGTQALERENAVLKTQVAQQRAGWQRAASFEIRTETPDAFEAWSLHILKELQGFNKSGGMVQLVAQDGFERFNNLRTLLQDIETRAPDEWEKRLEPIERLLFGSQTRASCDDLTPLNSSPEQRKTLRTLATATSDLRAHVKEILRLRAGIAPLEIVPGETRFDAGVHETSEFLEVPTDEVGRHNLILSVERGGFERQLPDGSKKLLQTARVRRAVYRSALPLSGASSSLSDASSSLSDAPSLSLSGASSSPSGASSSPSGAPSPSLSGASSLPGATSPSLSGVSSLPGAPSPFSGASSSLSGASSSLSGASSSLTAAPLSSSEVAPLLDSPGSGGPSLAPAIQDAVLDGDALPLERRSTPLLREHGALSTLDASPLEPASSMETAPPVPDENGRRAQSALLSPDADEATRVTGQL